VYEKDDVELIVLVLDGRGMVFWPRATVVRWALAPTPCLDARQDPV